MLEPWESFVMIKIIVSYCRVSATEQSTSGNGLDNQKHINDQAISKLMPNVEYTWLEDIVEVGNTFKGNNLGDILKNAKTYSDDSIIVMFDQTRFSRTDFFDALTKMREIVSSGLMIHFLLRVK
jgi:DNA invertase Pin-like site-specific DNA recombinase